VNYSISSLEDINKLIIHLENGGRALKIKNTFFIFFSPPSPPPLLTQKAADFLLFKQAVKFVKNKSHLTTEGLNQIVNIKASMNLARGGHPVDLKSTGWPLYLIC